jgi:hypothetical protein
LSRDLVVNQRVAGVVYLPVGGDPSSLSDQLRIRRYVVPNLGIPELVILAVPLAGVLGGILLFWVIFPRRAKRFGYASTRAYLRAAPRSDPEKRDAADLALKGLVWCGLGLIGGDAAFRRTDGCPSVLPR